MPFEGNYDWAAGQSVGAYLMKKYVRDNLLHLFYDCPPTRATLFHDEALVTVGNPIVRVINAASRFTHYAYQNAAADGDSWTQSAVLAPGSYNIHGYGSTSATSGQLTMTIDAFECLSQWDLYSAGLTHNVHLFSATVTLTQMKRYTITGTVDGKNALSTDYRIFMTYMTIVPLLQTGGDY